MSSPRTAVKAVRNKVKSAAAPRRAAKTPKAKAQRATTAKAPGAAKPADPSGDALRLAAAIEESLVSGEPAVSEAAQQKLLAALCKSYAQRVQAGGSSQAFGGKAVVSATDVMITASGLLRAADLQVFELGMWQSWTGR
jgi:hypothetical protein